MTHHKLPLFLFALFALAACEDLRGPCKDRDGDGHGEDGTQWECSEFSPDRSDCVELCDDCDDFDPERWETVEPIGCAMLCPDRDGDRRGDPLNSTDPCGGASLHTCVPNCADCADNDPTVWAEGPDGECIALCPDRDGDGFGDPDNIFDVCPGAVPGMCVEDCSDCDDFDPATRFCGAI